MDGKLNSNFLLRGLRYTPQSTGAPGHQPDERVFSGGGFQLSLGRRREAGRGLVLSSAPRPALASLPVTHTPLTRAEIRGLEGGRRPGFESRLWLEGDPPAPLPCELQEREIKGSNNTNSPPRWPGV